MGFLSYAITSLLNADDSLILIDFSRPPSKSRVSGPNTQVSTPGRKGARLSSSWSGQAASGQSYLRALIEF